MIKKIVFKKITFNNFNNKKIYKVISNKGLFVFPSGLGLTLIENDNFYFTALKKADYVFFDSGFFVLLLRLLKNIKVEKFSGYKFLSWFFYFLSKNKTKSIFCIDPNSRFSKSNKLYLKNLGLKKVYNCIAPKYDSTKILDKNLLKKINKIKPDFILTNIGGGTQEVLGLYLKENLRVR